MIKCDYGKVSISGDLATLLAELSTLVLAMYEEMGANLGKDKAKKLLELSFNNGFVSTKEKMPINNDAVDELLKILKALKKH